MASREGNLLEVVVDNSPLFRAVRLTDRRTDVDGNPLGKNERKFVKAMGKTGIVYDGCYNNCFAGGVGLDGTRFEQIFGITARTFTDMALVVVLGGIDFHVKRDDLTGRVEREAFVREIESLKRRLVPESRGLPLGKVTF